MQLATLTAALLTLAALAPAKAMSLPPAPASGNGITLVRDGCGPGGHRDYYGRCVPNYRPVPYYRACPPRFHPTPYGCRPNF